MTRPRLLTLLVLGVALSPAAAARAQGGPPVVGEAPANAAAPAPPFPLRLALQTEAALGATPGTFYNHLAGLRADLQFSPRVRAGAYLGYANLKGRAGRAHAGLGYAQLEYLAGDPAARLRVPLRFATGYLPNNGPIVRLAAGLAFALSPRVDLITELLAPMVWVTDNQMLLSMDLALEVALRL